jgi:hypothetical protein
MGLDKINTIRNQEGDTTSASIDSKVRLTGESYEGVTFKNIGGIFLSWKQVRLREEHNVVRPEHLVELCAGQLESEIMKYITIHLIRSDQLQVSGSIEYPIDATGRDHYHDFHGHDWHHDRGSYRHYEYYTVERH